MKAQKYGHVSVITIKLTNMGIRLLNKNVQYARR